MASPYRPLRPAPLAGGSQQLSSRESPHGERNRATLACQPCRDKRRKCSGERPVCRECSRRRLACTYAARPGQTRMASLKENNERMKSDLETLTELYWYLQTQPKDGLGDVLSSIQAGADPSEVIEGIKNRTSSIGVIPSSSSAPEVPLNDLRPAIVRDTTSNSSLLSQSTYISHETQTPTELPATEPPFSESSTQPPQAFECLYRGTEAFFTYTGCVFYIYDKGEAEASHNNLKPYFEAPGKSWLDFVSQKSLPSHLKPALCSLCIMAAVGLQYIKHPVPALDFVTSSSDGSYQFVGAFYESARHLLESVIEIDILEAIKVCAALTLFNTIGHATVALAYADMGINFALNLGPNLQIRPSNYSEMLWIRHKRVTRTLVTLRSWLVSTLGYVHSDHTGLQLGSQWLMDEREMTPNEIIQQELSKVIQIEADLLRTIDSFRELSPVLLRSTKQDLARWHQQLPEWMHLKVLLDASGNTTMTRRTVYLVHLFYLSASMLLARLAHSAQRSPHAEGNTMDPRYDVEEVRVAAGDGVEAARTAARILQLQMDEQTIYQRCWNCEFSAYMACLTLLHSAAQMQLHDYSPQVWKKELGYARSCLDVLEFCGKADEVAVHFEQVAQGYYNTLAAQAQPSDDIDVLDAPPDFDYLFSIPSSSPPHLVQMSRDLLERVSCPFDSPISLYSEGMLKAGLGSHTILQFNAIFKKDAKPRPAVEMALSSMPSGQFIGSSQPHGWDVFLNLKTL